MGIDMGLGAKQTLGMDEKPGNTPKSRRVPPPVETRWKPGQSGNPAGRPPGRSWQSDVRRLLAKRSERKAKAGEDDVDVQEEILDVVIGRARAGDLKAVDLLLDILPERAPKEIKVETVDIAERIKAARERAKNR